MILKQEFFGWVRTSLSAWVAVCRATRNDTCWRLTLQAANNRECCVLPAGTEPHPGYSTYNFNV